MKKKLIKKISEEEVLREEAFSSAHLIDSLGSCYVDSFKVYEKPLFNTALFVTDSKPLYWYEFTFKKESKEVFNWTVNNFSFVKQKLKRFHFLTKKIEEFQKELSNENFLNKNKEQILKIYEKFRSFMKEQYAYSTVTESADALDNEDYTIYVKDNKKAIEKLTSPSKLSNSEEEKLSLLKVALKYKKEKLEDIKKSEEYKKHINSFFWIKNSFKKAIFDESYFAQRLEEYLGLDESTLNKEINLLSNKESLIKQELADLEKKLNLSDNGKLFFEVLRTLSYIQDNRKKNVQRFVYAVDKIFEFINYKYKISKEELLYYLDEDLVNLLKKDKILTKQELKERKHVAFINFIEKDEIKKIILKGIQAKNLCEEIFKEKKEDERFKILKKFKQKLKKDDTFNIISKSSILMISSWLISEKRFPMYFLGKNDISLAYFSENIYEKEAFNLFNSFLKNKKTLLKFDDEVKEIFEKIKKFYETNIILNADEFSQNKILKILKKANDLLNELCFKTLCVENLDSTVLKEIAKKNNMKFKLLLDELKKAQNNNYSSFETRNLKQKIKILKENKLPLAIKKSKYLYTNYSKTSSDEFIKQDLMNCKNISEPKLNTFEFKDSNSISEYFSYIITLRDIRKDYLSMCQSLIYEYSKSFFKIIGLDKTYLKFTSVLEILKGEEYLKSVFEDIKKRKEGYEFFAYSYDEFFIRNTNLKKEEVEKFLESELINKDKLKGFVASAGISGNKIKGVARIIFDPEDKSFNEGEILITGMTRPEFVPLMKKASAIITNEGGITTHAAIVSRELQKPCIIGTKNATDILKDGDKIELDMSKGIIKLIQKNGRNN